MVSKMADKLLTKDNIDYVLFHTLLANTEYVLDEDSSLLKFTMDCCDKTETVLVPFKFGVTVKYFRWYIWKVSNYMKLKCCRD